MTLVGQLTLSNVGFLRHFSPIIFLILFPNISRVPFQPTGTNIVTNTAPTPGVRMRVVRSNGETANMVGLGEDLQLRIGKSNY